MSGTPMIVTAGQQEQGHGLTEPLLYAPLVPIATPVVKWATEVNRIEDLPRILRRAAKVATTAPTGPVFISLPGDILNNEAALDMGEVDARRYRACARRDAALEQLARRLLARQEAGDPGRPRDRHVATPSPRRPRWPRRWARRCCSRRWCMGRALPVASIPPISARSTATRNTCAACSRDYDLMFCVGSDVLKMSVWSEIEPLPRDDDGGRWSACATGRWARTSRPRSRCAPT